jgi:hypothetical protein
MKITKISVQETGNKRPPISVKQGQGSSGQSNVGPKNSQLTPIQVNS